MALPNLIFHSKNSAPASSPIAPSLSPAESSPFLPSSKEENPLAAAVRDLLPAGREGVLAELYRLMARLRVATPVRRPRRARRDVHGDRIDMRRTLRASLRTGGDVAARVEVRFDALPERPQVTDGGDRQREVPGVDRALHPQLEPLDGGLLPSGVGEEARRQNERARNRRVLRDDGGAPAQRRVTLTRQHQRERPVEGGIDVVSARQVGRRRSHIGTSVHEVGTGGRGEGSRARSAARGLFRLV